MFSTMDHRERVLTAANHSEPDRVPTALWGSAYGVTDPLYFALLKALGLGEPVAPFRLRKGHTINYYDDRVMEALDIDVRPVDCGFTDLGGPTAGGGQDIWGIRYAQSGIYLTATGHPLAGVTPPAGRVTHPDLESYPWPQVECCLRLEDFTRRARMLKETTDYAVIGRAVDSYGPFERCCALRGTEAFLIDLGSDPEYASLLIQKVTDTICRLFQLTLADAGPYLDIIELPGDDYAALQPIISPRMFDRFFAPAWRRIIDLVRSAAPHCKILFHSDGNMEPFLGRLIDLGVDIFHCLEPLPGVDMEKIKAVYGSRLCFWGAIDIKQAMSGDRAGAAAEARLRIQQLAPGGGYVLAPANHLQPNVPVENVIALYQAAREYGRYPIK